VQLATTLDLEASQPLRRALLSAINSKKKVISVDASQVQRVTTPCIQVLVAADSYAASKKKEFRLLQPSPYLQQALADMGLATEHVEETL
jgi:chemotaxis protein CheX